MDTILRYAFADMGQEVLGLVSEQVGDLCGAHGDSSVKNELGSLPDGWSL
jgi:hypothetical protein